MLTFATQVLEFVFRSLRTITCVPIVSCSYRNNTKYLPLRCCYRYAGVLQFRFVTILDYYHQPRSQESHACH